MLCARRMIIRCDQCQLGIHVDIKGCAEASFHHINVYVLYGIYSYRITRQGNSICQRGTCNVGYFFSVALNTN